MKKFKSTLFLVAMGIFSQHAAALSPLVHGVATLQIAVDANNLNLNFSSPLDNLIGFEHIPYNEQQQIAVDKMINQFNHVDALLMPTPAAMCIAKSVKLDSIVIKNESIPPNKVKQEGAGHADLDAEIIFHCQHVDQLKDVQAYLFKNYSNLHKLNVEVVSPHGQTVATLTPTNTQIRW
jgi:hypothetical protein